MNTKLVLGAAAAALAVSFASAQAEAATGTYSYAQVYDEDNGFARVAQGARWGWTAAPTASAAVSHSGVHPTYGVAQSGTARTSVSLATGQIKAFSTSNARVVADAESAWSEDVTFSIAGATASTVTRIKVLFRVHGTAVSDPISLHAVIADLHIGGAGVTYGNSKSGGQAQPNISVGHANFASFREFGVEGDRTFELGFDVVGATSRVTMNSRIQTLTFANATADYGNTSSVRFVLPTGVTFTSGSGTFLSAAVPEPATWAMMIGGFGFVGAATRRRLRGGASLA